MRRPHSRKDTEGQESVSEKKPSTNCCTGTRRREGVIQRCSTSGWQHFHLGNQTTHPLQFHSLSSLTASVYPDWVSVCCPLHPLYRSTLPPSILPHICTHILFLCLFVSLRRMSITAQSKEALIRGQECDASRVR